MLTTASVSDTWKYLWNMMTKGTAKQVTLELSCLKQQTFIISLGPESGASDPRSLVKLLLNCG